MTPWRTLDGNSITQVRPAFTQKLLRLTCEYTDTETRRRAASDLVRGLLEQFAKEVTEIFTQNVGQYLAEYEKDPARNWKSKDTALYLITSLSARSVSAQVRLSEGCYHKTHYSARCL